MDPNCPRCGCLCNGRSDVTCTDEFCSIAGPGEPYGPSTGCRVCWIRLGLDKQYPSEPPPESVSGPQYPSLWQQAANFAGAVTSHALQGFQKASQEEKERRLALCVVCESYDKKKDACFKCGCNLSVKASWQSQKCPIGKW